jgi:hypothetical protein
MYSELEGKEQIVVMTCCRERLQKTTNMKEKLSQDSQIYHLRFKVGTNPMQGSSIAI